MSKEKFTDSSEGDHHHEWIDNGESNRERIYLGVKYLRAKDNGDKKTAKQCLEYAFQKGYKPLNIRSLDYRAFTSFDPDTDEGKKAILHELTGELMREYKVPSAFPLTLSIIEMMLSLIEHDNFSSVCAAEIALICFVDFDKYELPLDDEGQYEVLDEIRSRLSGEGKSYSNKILALRDVLGGDVIGNDSTQQLPMSYISRCEEIARSILGEKEFDEIVFPEIEDAAWALDTTNYFTYGRYGFTQNLKNSTYPEFLDTYENLRGLLIDNERERLREGKPAATSEIEDVDFNWGLIRRIFSMFCEPGVKGNKAVKGMKLQHRFGTKPLSASILAEVACGKLLMILDEPDDANHNCTCTSEISEDGDTFLHHAPAGRPDSFAQYGNELFVTIEVSTAQDKSQPQKAKETSSGDDDIKGTVYFNDIQRAIVHITDEAEDKGHNMECPKFVFLVSRDIPSKYAKTSLKEILSAAAGDNPTIVIPMTFRDQIKFIDALRDITGKEIDGMSLDEWSGILHGIQERMANIDLESPQVSLTKLPGWLLDKEEMKEDYKVMNKGKGRNDDDGGHGM